MKIISGLKTITEDVINDVAANKEPICVKVDKNSAIVIFDHSEYLYYLDSLKIIHSIACAAEDFGAKIDIDILINWLQGK